MSLLGSDWRFPRSVLLIQTLTVISCYSHLKHLRLAAQITVSTSWCSPTSILLSTEFFTISPQHKNANIATLKCNVFYQKTSNFIFTNILRSKQWWKLQKYGNTKLALKMPLLPTLCVCENVECLNVKQFNVIRGWFRISHKRAPTFDMK